MFQWIWKEVLDYASDEFDKWLYDIDEYIYDKNPGPDDKLVSNTKKDLPNEKGIGYWERIIYLGFSNFNQRFCHIIYTKLI